MNAEDLRLLRALATRTQTVAAHLQLLLEWQGTVDVTADVQELTELQAAVGEIITRVQQRETVSWGSRHRTRARHPEPRRFTSSLPLSTDVDHGVHVQRYGMDARPIAESRMPPPISGRWNEDEP